MAKRVPLHCAHPAYRRPKARRGGAERVFREVKSFRFLTKPCSPTTLDSVIRKETLIRQSRGKLQEDLMRVAGQGIKALQRIEACPQAVPRGLESMWAVRDNARSVEQA